MNKYRKETQFDADDRTIKPVLIVSERTLSDYSITMRHLLVGLADESIPMGLICPAGSNVESLVPLPVEVIKHPAYEMPLLWRQNKRMLLERLAKFGPTILHCLCQSKVAFTRRLSRQIGLPYVLTANSPAGRIRQISALTNRCGRIIVPAKSIANSILKKYPKLQNRIEQVSVGTFVDDHACCFNEENSIANLVTCFSGEDRKGFAVFLGAVKRLAEDGYQFMLVIMSHGKAERQLRRMLTDSVFSEIAIVIPKLEPSRSVLAAGDIFIRAAISDSFEPLLLEAMSVGNAIAACKGGVDDFIIEGKTAQVFDAGDEKGIFEALRDLMETREAAKKLARSAQEYLRKEHTVSAMVSATVEIYRKVQEEVYSAVYRKGWSRI